MFLRVDSVSVWCPSWKPLSYWAVSGATKTLPMQMTSEVKCMFRFVENNRVSWQSQKKKNRILNNSCQRKGFNIYWASTICQELHIHFSLNLSTILGTRFDPRFPEEDRQAQSVSVTAKIRCLPSSEAGVCHLVCMTPVCSSLHHTSYLPCFSYTGRDRNSWIPQSPSSLALLIWSPSPLNPHSGHCL